MYDEPIEDGEDIVDDDTSTDHDAEAVVETEVSVQEPNVGVAGVVFSGGPNGRLVEERR